MNKLKIHISKYELNKRKLNQNEIKKKKINKTLKYVCKICTIS